LSPKNFSRLFGLSSAFRLLEKKQFVGGAAAFGDEEEFVFGALARVEVDLGGEVGARVYFFEKIERGDLGVAEIFFRVGLVNALREILGIVSIGPHLLTFFGEDGAGAGVLAHRENATGGDLGVFQQRVCDVAVVVGGLGVLEDRGDLLKVLRAQEEIRVVKRLAGEVGERLGRDLQDFATLERRGADALFREQAILGVIGAEREGILVEEGRRGHGFGKLGWKTETVKGGGHSPAVSRGPSPRLKVD
jgi:hypothetical protein